MKKINYTFGKLNCAETIIKEFNERNGTNIPISLGSGMGSGLTIGSICGALNAAILIIGYLYGRESEEIQNNAKVIANEYMNLFKEKYSSELCKDLKKDNNRDICNEIVNFAYESLEKVIN